MKIKTLYILHLILCYGCKVNKEKSELRHTARQSQSRLETSTSWGQFNSLDSSYRYWHYTGDSVFFFHPDLGLWSRSGQIAYGEQRALKRQTTSVDHSYDSIGTENNKTESLTSSKKDSYPLSVWSWLLVIIPMALLIYRLCWRK